MRRLLLLALTILPVPLLVVTASPAQACSCVMAGVSKQVAWADAVFEGEVVETRRGEYQQVLRVAVSRVYRGDVVERVDVVTGNGGGDCGVTLPEGRPVLIFASMDHGELGTSTCAGTGLRLHHQHPALADWHEPESGTLVSAKWDDDGSSAASTAWWWLGGLAAVGAIGAVYVARRRSPI